MALVFCPKSSTSAPLHPVKDCDTRRFHFVLFWRHYYSWGSRRAFSLPCKRREHAKDFKSVWRALLTLFQEGPGIISNQKVPGLKAVKSIQLAYNANHGTGYLRFIVKPPFSGPCIPSQRGPRDWEDCKPSVLRLSCYHTLSLPSAKTAFATRAAGNEKRFHFTCCATAEKASLYFAWAPEIS